MASSAQEVTAKNIVLFGRTGSGKSTIGNMLIHGCPNPNGGFTVGDGFRGVTSTISVKDGRGWMVTDTIGFGEPETGTVGTILAEKRLCTFLEKLRSDYLYIVYVVKQGRMQDSDTVTWELFKQIFEGGEKNFVVVFTNSSRSWLQENIQEIKNEFEGCDRFIAVDFPPSSENEQRDKLNAEDRDTSLKHLESTLAGYGFAPVTPNICHMNAEQLWAHVKKTMGHLIKHVAQRFMGNGANPYDWIIKKLTGVFFK